MSGLFELKMETSANRVRASVYYQGNCLLTIDHSRGLSLEPNLEVTYVGTFLEEKLLERRLGLLRDFGMFLASQIWLGDANEYCTGLFNSIKNFVSYPVLMRIDCHT